MSEEIQKIKKQLSDLREQKKSINLTNAKKVVGKIPNFDAKMSYSFDRENGNIIQTDLSNPEKVKQMEVKKQIRKLRNEYKTLKIALRMERVKKSAEKVGIREAKKLSLENKRILKIAERKAKLDAQMAKLEQRKKSLK